MKKMKLISVDELAILLKCKKSTIYQKTHLKQIPHYKINNKLLFDTDEIFEWIALHKEKVININIEE